MAVDRELIQLATQGDTDALVQLLENLGPVIRKKIGPKIPSVWRSVLDEDDILQVTCFEAFIRIPQFEFRGDGSMEAWISTIAEHNLRDAIQELEAAKRPDARKRLQPNNSDESLLSFYELLGGTSATPSRQAATLEARRILVHAIGRLPEDYRKAVQMYDLEGCAADVVATSLGRSLGAFYMLRARALDRLREVLPSASKMFVDG